MKMRALRPILLTATTAGLAVLTLAPFAMGQGTKVPPAPTDPKTKAAEPATTTSAKPIDFTNGNYNGVNFETKVGSFKLLGSDPALVEGKLDFNFKGTVLISNLEAGSKVSVGGDVRKEYETDDKDKVLYFGNGKITITGRFRAVQFFGQNLKGRFFGWGIFRFYGEFDKNLDTGNYQVDGTPKMPFGTGGSTVPISGGGAQGKIKIKKVGG